MTGPIPKKTRVFEWDTDVGGMFPISKEILISWIEEKTKCIPKEFQNNVLFHFVSDEQIDIGVSYERAESLEEAQAREDNEKKYKDLEREWEIKELARLQQKYGISQST